MQASKSRKFNPVQESQNLEDVESIPDSPYFKPKGKIKILRNDLFDLDDDEGWLEKITRQAEEMRNKRKKGKSKSKSKKKEDSPKHDSNERLVDEIDNVDDPPVLITGKTSVV